MVELTRSMIKRWGEGKTLYSLCGLLRDVSLPPIILARFLLKIYSVLSTIITLRPITLKSSGAYDVAVNDSNPIQSRAAVSNEYRLGI